MGVAGIAGLAPAEVAAIMVDDCATGSVHLEAKNVDANQPAATLPHQTAATIVVADADTAASSAVYSRAAGASPEVADVAAIPVASATRLTAVVDVDAMLAAAMDAAADARLADCFPDVVQDRMACFIAAEMAAAAMVLTLVNPLDMNTEMTECKAVFPVLQTKPANRVW